MRLPLVPLAVRATTSPLEDKSDAVETVNWICLGIFLFVFVARTVIKFGFRRKPGIDDLLFIFATVSLRDLSWNSHSRLLGVRCWSLYNYIRTRLKRTRTTRRHYTQARKHLPKGFLRLRLSVHCHDMLCKASDSILPLRHRRPAQGPTKSHSRNRHLHYRLEHGFSVRDWIPVRSSSTLGSVDAALLQ